MQRDTRHGVITIDRLATHKQQETSDFDTQALLEAYVQITSRFLDHLAASKEWDEEKATSFLAERQRILQEIQRLPGGSLDEKNPRLQDLLARIAELEKQIEDKTTEFMRGLEGKRAHLAQARKTLRAYHTPLGQRSRFINKKK